jgi:signal transduction histidine kinase
MRLSEFINENRDQIIREWEGFAKTLSPDGTSPTILRDHVSAIIRSIVENMETFQGRSEEVEKSKGLGPSGPIDEVAAVHVNLRVETGFDLVQIIAEYRALRSSALRLWARDDPEGFTSGAPEIIRFNEAIDQNVAKTVQYYQEREIQYRDRFLGILGHDLRNPIQSILVGSVFLSGQRLNKRQLGTVSLIVRSARRLNSMVGDILDFARGRLGSPMPLALAAVNLTVSAREVIDEVKPTHPGVEIAFDASGDLHGNWDPERLRQMISNLLINAIQHGGAKQVRVTAKGDDDTVFLEVHNLGEPIPEEMLRVIFDPLFQGNDLVQTREGLGLGLFIVDQIVSAHRGTITVSSSEEEGTIFLVRLPRRLPS